MNYMMMGLLAACVPPELTPEPPVCGDRIVQASEGEECDDGRENSDNAACTDSCTVAACGDGLVRTGAEACDNGSANAEDAPCTHLCTIATCGDGFVLVGVEECDAGDENSNSGPCTLGCTTAVCGDGFVHEGVEQCDDGDSNGVGLCDSDCTTAPVCGDGFVAAGTEECDDGNHFGGDGCSPECQWPRSFPLAFATATIVGDDENPVRNSATAGDVNGDGFDDILLQAFTSTLLFNGPLSGELSYAAASLDLGNAVPGRGVGDLEDDGYGDFFIRDGSTIVVYRGGENNSFSQSRLTYPEIDTQVAGISDMDGDSLGGLLVGEWLSDLGGESSGVTYVLDAPFPASSSVTSSTTASLVGQPLDVSGVMLSAADLTGDGVDDAVIAAPENHDSVWAGGAIYVVAGPMAGTIGLASADAVVRGETMNDKIGDAMVTGDINGDGVDDLIVSGRSIPDKVWVFHGPLAGTLTLSDAVAVLEGQAIKLATGDVNGDGFDDIVVANENATVPGRDLAGVVSIVLGPVDGDQDLSFADIRIEGLVEDAALGRSISVADLDGDGLGDLVVGSGLGGDPGAIYIIAGSSL